MSARIANESGPSVRASFSHGESYTAWSRNCPPYPKRNSYPAGENQLRCHTSILRGVLTTPLFGGGKKYISESEYLESSTVRDNQRMAPDDPKLKEKKNTSK